MDDLPSAPVLLTLTIFTAGIVLAGYAVRDIVRRRRLLRMRLKRALAHATTVIIK